MVKVTIFVEGGGYSNLNAKCRQGFSEFFRKLNIKASVIACGDRRNAYNSFSIGLKNSKNNEYCLLLVDSEAPITHSSVWQHVLLREGDKWQKPDNASEEHLHFMTECMEAWFMADKKVLADYYGKDFNQNALSKNSNIENISKQDLYTTLNNATRHTNKGGYSKGGHSFEILSKIDAHKVINSCSYAKRLHDKLHNITTSASL